MVRYLSAVLVTAVFLIGCGGGGDPPAQPVSFASAPLALADSSACQANSADYAMVNGQCLKVFTPMSAQGAAPLPPQRALPVLTNSALFAWAEQHYLQYFNGAQTNGVLSGFTYRFYAGTQSYIGIADGGVYVLGPAISGNRILYVGQMSSFTCLVYVFACDIPQDSTTDSVLAVGGWVTSSVDFGGDSDWHAIFLTAGQSYVFNLEGSPTGQGTLADTFLVLYDGFGAVLAQNDDTDTNQNSRVTYTPASTGWYYLAAQAYDTSTGSYRLSAALGSSGGGGGGGGTVEWNSSFSADEIVEFNPTLAVNGREGWTFQVTGGSLAVETVFAAQYTANLYVTTGDTLQSCVNGGAFNHYTDYAFVGQFGFRSFSLPPGSYGICVQNSANTSNAMRVEFQHQPTVVGFHYSGLRFNTVVQTVSSGGRVTQPATVGETYRTIVDGANSGGKFYIIPASQEQNFLNGNAFTYYEAMTAACGASGRASPGLCELTGVGQYVIAYENDTGDPQSIVIVGRDYVPD